MLGRGDITPALVAKANCIVVLPDVKKFGFGIGGSGGRGAMSCRQGKDFSGPWSPPALYTIGGASFGLQVGGSSTDFVLLVMDQKGVDTLLKGKVKLGRDASVAAGPNGATSAGTVGGSDMLSYGRTSGLFAGMSMGGASIEPDNGGNAALYGRPVMAREILRGNAAQTPPAGEPLITLLSTKIPTHSR